MLKLSVPTHAREEMVDVTALLRSAVKENGWNDGILTVFSPHTTCGLTINEGFDPDVPRDMLAFLKARIPQDWGFRHGEGNSDAAMAVLGMIVGAAVCHNFGLASSADGPTARGQIAVILGLVVVAIIAVTNVTKKEN